MTKRKCKKQMQKDSFTHNNNITNLKALGIVLMVVGHSCCSIPYVVHYLYMFHMPLFFFASGYCFKRRYLEEPFTFLKKRMGGAYLPFVKWSIIFLLLHNFFYEINIYNNEYGYKGTVSHSYDFHEAIERIVNIVTIMTDSEQLLGGFWFLRSLFFGSIIAWIALRICKRPWISSVGILTICIVMNKFVFEVPLLKLHTREFAAALIMSLAIALHITKCQSSGCVLLYSL